MPGLSLEAAPLRWAAGEAGGMSSQAGTQGLGSQGPMQVKRPGGPAAGTEPVCLAPGCPCCYTLCMYFILL